MNYYFSILNKKSYAYLTAVVIVIFCTIVNFVLSPYLKDSNLIMVYLLGVTVVALLTQIGPSLLASVLSLMAYDFFFLPRLFSFSVVDAQSMFTLIVMLIVTQIITYLSNHMRSHTALIRKVQAETEAERFRNILLSSVSHDLRTPLTAIMGSASSLLHLDAKFSDEIRQELLKNIYHESERLNQLVNNILQIVRLESGAVEIVKQPHAPEDILGIVLEKMKHRLVDKVIKVNLPENTPFVNIDITLVCQVFINLLENAIKFSSEDTSIDISVEYEHLNVIFKIADRGPGVVADEMTKIFDKFYRSQKPETNGIGLGLAICKGIIQAHEGHIWVEQREQGGAIFCFKIPRVSDDAR